MSLTSSLYNAVSGLNAASRMAEVVSSNISNAMTDGYGVRKLELSSQVNGGRSGGVRIDGITRLVDRGLLSDRWRADAALAHDDRIRLGWSDIEQVTGKIDDPGSLAARLRQLESALLAAEAAPESDLALKTVLASLHGVAEGFNVQSSELNRMRGEAEAAIANDVARLNAGLAQVEEFNTSIANALARGDDPSALYDARQRAVDDIATIVPLRPMERANGKLALMTTGGVVLLDDRRAEVGFVQRPVVTEDMTYANGLLAGLTVDGRAVSLADGYGKLDGGTLGAALEMRDLILPGHLDQLDLRAADLMRRFEDSGVDPTWIVGTPGLFTDNGGPYVAADQLGLAGRLSVNVAVDPDQGGALWRLRDGTAAATPGPAGNSEGLASWRSALSASQPLLPGGLGRSAFGHAADLVAQGSTGRVAAEDAQALSAARHQILRQSELSRGVDTDIEMQTLLLAEQAYEANAKMIQTLDQLMQTLLEI